MFLALHYIGRSKADIIENSGSPRVHKVSRTTGDACAFLTTKDSAYKFYIFAVPIDVSARASVVTQCNAQICVDAIKYVGVALQDVRLV